MKGSGPVTIDDRRFNRPIWPENNWPEIIMRATKRARGPAMTTACCILVAMGAGPAVAADGPPATPQPATAPPAFNLADYGATVYEQRCSNCHAIENGAPSIAPPLFRLFGRRAGSVTGYAYSPKLQDSNLVWDAASLNDWLSQSTIATPDIRLRHAGLNDAIQRDAVVAFIKAASR